MRRWHRTVARLRIHGTTRRQVWAHYEETDKQALQPLPSAPFAYFEQGTRTVHPDGHVEVASGYYSVAAHLIGEEVAVRWDEHMIRVFHGEAMVAVHRRVAAGAFAPRRPGQPDGETCSSQRAHLARLLGRCAHRSTAPDVGGGSAARAWCALAPPDPGRARLGPQAPARGGARRGHHRLAQAPVSLPRLLPPDRDGRLGQPAANAHRRRPLHSAHRRIGRCRICGWRQTDPPPQLLGKPATRPASSPQRPQAAAGIPLTDYGLQRAWRGPASSNILTPPHPGWPVLGVR